MPEEVRLSPDGSFILVRSTGAPNLKEMEQTLLKIRELIEENPVNRVLVDARPRHQQPPLFDIYSGGEMLAKTLGGGTRIAVLVMELMDNHSFFETVAVNRGADITFFQDEETALRWLLSDEM